MQNLHLLEFLAEAFQCHVPHIQCLAVLVELGSSSIENDAPGTEKLLLETQVKILHSEVNLII